MARTSDKHGPRKDEGLKEEVASVSRGSPVQEARERGRPESEPDPDEVVSVGQEDVAPRSLPQDELERRQDLGRYLERKFPATREEILESARNMDAPPEVLSELEQLPDGTYEGVPEIWETLGGKVEGGRTH
jgi:hypothetical protein